MSVNPIRQKKKIHPIGIIVNLFHTPTDFLKFKV